MSDYPPLLGKIATQGIVQMHDEPECDGRFQRGMSLKPGGNPHGACRLRTPDLAQGFWAAEENDLTRIYRSGWLLRAALKEKLGPCRSFSCRSFRRV